MRAIGLYQYLPISDPVSLLDLEVPDPAPSGRDLVVRVHAVSVNPVDTKVRSPKSHVEAQPKILGWDAAGVVEDVGEAVTLFKPGDEVYYAGSMIRPGCNSELHLVDERIVGHKPRTLSFAEAAALPLTTITAWEALFDRMAIARTPSANRGRRLLVIGGAGGVGSIAIQLAKQLAGLEVIATASRPDSDQWCRELGADHVINHHAPLAEQLKAQGIEGVEFILCTNSVERYIEPMAEVIAPQGKICTIIGTKDNQPANMNVYFGKSVTFAWELMYTRSTYQTADMQAQHALLEETARLVDEGVLRTTVREVLPGLNAENLRRAHAQLESGATIGKVVVDGPWQ